MPKNDPNAAVLGKGGGAQDPNAGQPQNAHYRLYEVETQEVVAAGKLFIPSAGPDGTPPTVVKTGAARAIKLVSFRLERYNKMPVPPTITPGPNEVYLDGDVKAATPVPLANKQGFLFALAGWYRYALLKPPAVKTS